MNNDVFSDEIKSPKTKPMRVSYDAIPNLTSISKQLTEPENQIQNQPFADNFIFSNFSNIIPDANKKSSSPQPTPDTPDLKQPNTPTQTPIITPKVKDTSPTNIDTIEKLSTKTNMFSSESSVNVVIFKRDVYV